MPEINLWGFIPQKFLSSAQLIWAHPIHCCWTVMFSKGDNTPIRFRYISILMFSQGDLMPNVITKVLVLFLHLSFYEVKCQQIHFSSIFLLHCWLDELTILCRYICTISWVHLAKNGAEKYMWTDGSEFKLLNSVSNELNIELDTAVQNGMFCKWNFSVEENSLSSGHSCFHTFSPSLQFVANLKSHPFFLVISTETRIEMNTGEQNTMFGTWKSPPTRGNWMSTFALAPSHLLCRGGWWNFLQVNSTLLCSSTDSSRITWDNAVV